MWQQAWEGRAGVVAVSEWWSPTLPRSGHRHPPRHTCSLAPPPIACSGVSGRVVLVAERDLVTALQAAAAGPG